LGNCTWGKLRDGRKVKRGNQATNLERREVDFLWLGKKGDSTESGRLEKKRIKGRGIGLPSKVKQAEYRALFDMGDRERIQTGERTR